MSATVAVLALLLTVLGPAAAAPRAPWLYATSFQRGKLLVFDTASGRPVHSLPVEDKAGVIGVHLSPDGKLLYVVDGDTRSRLRIFQAADLKALGSYPFENRLLLLGGGPVSCMSADGRWLFLHTYDYASDASGVRVFDTKKRVFLPLGLRNRPHGAHLVGAPGGLLFAYNEEFVYSLTAASATPDFVLGKKAPLPLEDVSAAVSAPDGKSLYLLEFLHDQQAPWRLARWRSQGNSWPAQVEVVDLRSRLKVPEDPRGGASSLAVSPDGKLVAVQRGPRAWVLEAETLQPRLTVELPEPGDALALTGDALLAVSHDGTVMRQPLAGGKTEVLMKGAIPPAGPPLEVWLAPAP